MPRGKGKGTEAVVEPTANGHEDSDSAAIEALSMLSSEKTERETSAKTAREKAPKGTPGTRGPRGPREKSLEDVVAKQTVNGPTVLNIAGYAAARTRSAAHTPREEAVDAVLATYRDAVLSYLESCSDVPNQTGMWAWLKEYQPDARQQFSGIDAAIKHGLRPPKGMMGKTGPTANTEGDGPSATPESGDGTEDDAAKEALRRERESSEADSTSDGEADDDSFFSFDDGEDSEDSDDGEESLAPTEINVSDAGSAAEGLE